MPGSSNHMPWVNSYFRLFLSVKQNIGHAWLFRPHALGKLTLSIISLSIKQNFGHVWLLGLHALGKLILHIIPKY